MDSRVARQHWAAIEQVQKRVDALAAKQSTIEDDVLSILGTFTAMHDEKPKPRKKKA